MKTVLTGIVLALEGLLGQAIVSHAQPTFCDYYDWCSECNTGGCGVMKRKHRKFCWVLGSWHPCGCDCCNYC